jgi:DNA-binding IclR family transcriptional regulator
LDQLNLDTERACTAMRQHRASLKNPPKTVEEYLVTLAEQGLSRFSQALGHYAAEL